MYPIRFATQLSWELLWWPSSIESACNAEGASIPGWGRSSGGGHGNPLQYSCLENPKERRACPASDSGVAESDMAEMTGHEHMHQ